MKPSLLLIDKPTGMTSFDVIRTLKKKLNTRDLGHGGTLDKFASGLLPVFVGEGLKLVRFFLESYPTLPTYWKTYQGTLKLGVQTETGDPEGKILLEQLVPSLTPADIERAMAEFTVAPYLQTPPKYSAKKIEGERASDLAREGVTPELKPVEVAVRSFKLLGFTGTEASFEVTCSKGTYVRVLAEDLAKKLGTVAYLTALKRTAIGNFSVSQALALDSSDLPAKILPMHEAVSFLPAFPLMPCDPENLALGKTVDVLARLANSGLPASVYRGVDPQGFPLALIELNAAKRATYLRGLKKCEI